MKNKNISFELIKACNEMLSKNKIVIKQKTEDIKWLTRSLTVT